MSELWSRRNVIATLIVGILTCGVTVALFFFDNWGQEIGTQTIESSESSEPSRPTVSISSIHVSDVAMDVPAAFEIGIQVSGTTDLPARNMNVTLDFGRAEIQVCGYTPREAVRKIVNEDKSYRRLEVAELRQEETLHIRCLISTPTFKKVAIEGGNIFRGRSIDFAQYRSSLLSEPIGFWRGLGRFFVVFLSIMLCFKIVGLLFPNFS